MLEKLVFYLGSAAKSAGFTSGLTCISAFIIFFLLSLFARKTSPIRKRTLYHTCSIYLLLVGLYQIFLALNMSEQLDPERALFYHRMTYFFGLPTIPIFLYVVLILTVGGYTELMASSKIAVKWKVVIRKAWGFIWIFTAAIWLINLVDMLTGLDILLAARIEPIPDSFVPLRAIKSEKFAILGINLVWRIWQITFAVTVGLALAFLVRAIRKPSVKWLNTFAFFSTIHILFTAIQGVIGYNWTWSFPIPVYSATFLILAFSFVLIGEIVEARENVIVAYTSSYGSRMVSVVAHEMGTPLFIIRGYLNKMQHDFVKKLHKKDGSVTRQDLEKYHQFLNKTEDALDRLSRTVDDLKAKAGIFQTKLQPVPLNELIDDLIETNEYVHKQKSFTFEIRTDPNLRDILIDPEQMRLILRNLIENAIDALPQTDGRVKITTRLRGEQVFIGIQDNGSGIPEKFISRVNEPFFTTKLKGTGLGLSIVQGFLQEIRGNLKLDSIEGSGTRIEIAIPYHT